VPVVSAAAAEEFPVVAVVSVPFGTELHVLVVSVAAGVGAHVPVVSAAAAEEFPVVAVVSDPFGTEVHVVVGSVAPAEGAADAAELAVASAAAGDVALVSAELEVSVVGAEAGVASAAVGDVTLGSGVLELFVVVAGASVVPAVVPDVSLGFVAGFVAVELSVVVTGVADPDDCAEVSDAGGGGLSARAGAANRNAQKTAAITATVQPRNPRNRCPKRIGRWPEIATELPSISASSPWLRSL
jgi:hypothetical protein